MLAPFRLDVAEQPWPIASAAAVVSLNMIYITPWDAGRALIRGAAAVLGPGAMLFLYGPFRRGATHTSPSNEAFDRQLRAQNPAWASAIWRRWRGTRRRMVSARRRSTKCRRTIYPSCCASARRNRFQTDRRTTMQRGGEAVPPRLLPLA